MTDFLTYVIMGGQLFAKHRRLTTSQTILPDAHPRPLKKKADALFFYPSNIIMAFSGGTDSSR